MAFADTIRRWLWQGADPLLDKLSGHDEKMAGELGELKKLVRRQGIQQESLVREISAKLDAAAANGGEQEAAAPDPYLELAEAYFHLEAALAHTHFGAGIREALAITREKLDDVCREAAVEIIRDCDVPFDSRIHEALDRAPDGEAPMVRNVAAPGFIHNGRVVKAARVMLSGVETAVYQEESEENYGE